MYKQNLRVFNKAFVIKGHCPVSKGITKFGTQLETHKRDLNILLADENPKITMATARFLTMMIKTRLLLKNQ